MLSPRTADYLETIYVLSLQHDTVGVSQVAADRKVTVPTARSAIGRLKDDGYVRQERYGKVLLTQKGRERAARVYRSHTVLFRFLHEVLRVQPSRADEEACRLEHGLSQDTLAKLLEFLDAQSGLGPKPSKRDAAGGRGTDPGGSPEDGG
jgi:DtxR family Mn-dependent transcriptional regulator